MELATYCQSLDNDLARIAAVSTDLETPMPTCPGWNLGRLLGHLGRVHRMALAVLTTGAMSPAPPDQLETPPKALDSLRAYYAQSSGELVEVLRSVDPAQPCWTFLGGPDIASFWHRRMAQEHAIHRFDAEVAVGDPQPIPAAIALDGIDEYLLIANRTITTKRQDFALGGTIHLHTTDPDTTGEWMISQRDGALHATHEHGKGDAAIRGRASDLLLGAWGRIDLRADDRFERFGSAEVIAGFASLGGT